jgi:DNA-binding LytR/AlgR family response regulator
MRNQEIAFYDHLDRIYSELRYDKFLYVHKSYLVNYNNIVEVSAKKLIMSNGEVIPISQSRRKNVKEELKRFDLEGHVLYGKTMERGAM